MTTHKRVSRAILPGVLLILALAFAGCVPVPEQPGASAPAATETPLPATETPAPPLELPTPTTWLPAQSAIEALARQLSIEPSQVQLVSSEPAEWPDGCLGVSQPGIMCTQAIVPGYRFIMQASGQQYEVRTDQTGAAAVVVPAKQAKPGDPPAVMAARTAMAVQLGLELDMVKVWTVEPMTWPDACLGVPQPDEMCAQVLTPGYRIVIEVNGVRYVLHTDETGAQVRAAPVATEEPAVITILRDLIAGQLGISADGVQVISIEAVEWPDACLGVQRADIVCAQVVTAGYKIVLIAEGQRFTYHTDAPGNSILLVEEIVIE